MSVPREIHRTQKTGSCYWRCRKQEGVGGTRGARKMTKHVELAIVGY